MGVVLEQRQEVAFEEVLLRLIPLNVGRVGNLVYEGDELRSEVQHRREFWNLS